MRTTITLDDDLAALLQQLCRDRRQTFTAVVNDVVRRGLASATASSPGPRRRKYTTAPVSLGPPLLPDLDNVAEILALAEGEDHR